MIRKKITNILNSIEILPALVDNTIYQSNQNSYAGDSLTDSNILFVFNSHLNINTKIIREIANTEHFDYANIFLNDISVNNIKKAGASLIGPISHIVNIFSQTENNSFFTNNGLYNENELLGNLHQTIQSETNYLISVDLPSSITICFIENGTADSEIISKNIEFMVKGLSRVLGYHNIICNGIISGKNTPYNIIFNSISFLCSKYGHLLAGETIHLRA